MRRREFIAAIGGAFASSQVWPTKVWAQASRPVSPRLAILTPAQATSPIERAFREGLHALGYAEGQNLDVDFRTAEFKTDRLAPLATDLVATKPDVIFSSGSEATAALKAQTTNIPIVMTSSNPVGLGFVASLARPGGNITGLSIFGPEIAGKRLELLKELAPASGNIAAFWNPSDPGAQFSLKDTEDAAATLNIGLFPIETRAADDFESAVRAAKAGSATAIVLLPAPLLSRYSERLANLAVQNGLPMMFYSEDAVRAGGLISYGASIIDVYRRAAYYVDRILKGAKPADLPIEQPAKFELAVNQKTAKAMGLAIPDRLLATADQVVE